MSMFLNLCQRFISPGIISHSALALTTPGNCTLISIRNKVRCYFPKPKEVKRIKVHGWKKRMSTTEGRRVLMRRILKGRHALSH